MKARRIFGTIRAMRAYQNRQDLCHVYISDQIYPTIPLAKRAVLYNCYLSLLMLHENLCNMALHYHSQDIRVNKGLQLVRTSV